VTFPTSRTPDEPLRVYRLTDTTRGPTGLLDVVNTRYFSSRRRALSAAHTLVRVYISIYRCTLITDMPKVDNGVLVVWREPVADSNHEIRLEYGDVDERP